MKDETTLHKLSVIAAEWAVKYSFQVIGGMVILFVAWVLSRFASRILHRWLVEKHIDITVIKFITQTVRIIILALGVLMTLSSFGVQIAPLVAGLSVAGVGIGLALQGPLSNYTSGATLVFTKPFKVGDIIEVKGYQGEVKDISLPRTELYGIDGSIIIIPNKHIIGEVIKNYSHYRKLDISIGVAYDSDVDKALAIIDKIVKADQRIAKDIMRAGIKEFADSSIILQLIVGVDQAHYGEVKFAVNKHILEQFRANGIVMPFPQRDVYIHQKS
jgi:small conductance mechanosensitive channel